MIDVPDDVRGSAPLLTTKDLILEMRRDIKALASDVTDIKQSQAISGERRSTMFQRAADIDKRLSGHDDQIGNLERWRDEASGAMGLVKWALGGSLIASMLVVLEIVTGIVHR